MSEVIKVLMEYDLPREVASIISRDAGRMYFKETRIQPFENISKFAMDVRIPRLYIKCPGWDGSLKDRFAFFCWCTSYYVAGESPQNASSAYLDTFVHDGHMSSKELDETIRYIGSIMY